MMQLHLVLLVCLLYLVSLVFIYRNQHYKGCETARGGVVFSGLTRWQNLTHSSEEPERENQQFPVNEVTVSACSKKQEKGKNL